MANARIAAGIQHLLVVEDSAIIALELEFSLYELGIARVSQAARPEVALDVLRAGDVDAALIDIMLGDEDGRSVGAELTALGIPFAIMTGLDRVDALRAQFPGVPILTKPFMVSDLEAALEQLC